MADPRVAAPRYAGNVPRFYVYWTLANFFLWAPIWVLFLQDKGLTLAQIGVIDSAGWIMKAVLEVPTGAVADTYGRRFSLALGTLLTGVAMVLIATQPVSAPLVVGILLWSVAWTFISGADEAFLYDSLKADARADGYPRVMGTYLAVMQTAGGAAALAGGWLAARSMALCFALTGVAMLAATAVALTFREPPRGDRSAGTAASYWRTIRNAIAVTATHPRVRFLVLFGAAAMAFPFVLLYIFLQPYARDLALPVQTLGPLVLAARLAGVLGSMLSARVSARIGRRATLLGVPAVLVGCQVLLWALAAPAAVTLFLVVALANSVFRPVQSVLLNDEIPSEQRATIVSLQALVFTALVAVIEVSLLAFADRRGVPAAIGVSGLLLLLCLASGIRAWLQTDGRARAAGSAA